MPPAASLADKSNIMGPVVAAAIAGIVGWVLTISVRAGNNETMIHHAQESHRQDRERAIIEIERLRARVAELEQQGSMLKERTRE